MKHRSSGYKYNKLGQTVRVVMILKLLHRFSINHVTLNVVYTDIVLKVELYKSIA
jgi:hypothetical protein